jgi:hypothetical protein
MTPIEISESLGRVLERRGGLRAGSSPISWRFLTGRGPVVGEEPVQSTRMSEKIIFGLESFSFAGLT